MPLDPSFLRGRADFADTRATIAADKAETEFYRGIAKTFRVLASIEEARGKSTGTVVKFIPKRDQLGSDYDISTWGACEQNWGRPMKFARLVNCAAKCEIKRGRIGSVPLVS